MAGERVSFFSKTLVRRVTASHGCTGCERMSAAVEKTNSAASLLLEHLGLTPFEEETSPRGIDPKQFKGNHPQTVIARDLLVDYGACVDAFNELDMFCRVEGRGTTEYTQDETPVTICPVKC